MTRYLTILKRELQRKDKITAEIAEGYGQMFVICVGNLALLGGSVGRDLGPATHLVRFPFFFLSFYLFFSLFSFLFFSFLFFFPDAMGNGKFYSGISLAF